MNSMDSLWLSAPAPALRLWPAGSPEGPSGQGWQFNAAAAAWGEAVQADAAQWAALAHHLRSMLCTDGAALKGHAELLPFVELAWTAVPLPEGWLVWLEGSSAQADGSSEKLKLVQRLGDVGLWEYDLATGKGHWDERMLGMLGFEAGQHAPHIDTAMALVHPADRAAVLHDHQRSMHAAGRYEARYRMIVTGGHTKHMHAVYEVQNGADGRPARMAGMLIDETQGAAHLRATEAAAKKWFRAVDLANLSVWHLDMVSGHVYSSDWNARVPGREDRDDLTIKDVLDVIHPDDVPAIVKAGQEALDSHRVVDVEIRFRNREGGYRTLLTRRVAERDKDGKVIGVSGVSFDMTARAQERERAQAYAQRIDRIADAAGVGIWSVDIETMTVEWNDQMFRLYGLPRDQPPPNSRRWLKDLVHPEDREVARKHRPLVGTGPQGLHAEYRIVRPDGSVRWVASWSRREVLGGRELAFGVSLDITDQQRTQLELRQTQERARLATESAGIGTWERDLRTGSVKWDAQMYRLHGLPVGPETPPESLRNSAYHADDRAMLKRGNAAAGRKGDGYDSEFRVVLPDASIHWMTSRGLVKRDAQGNPERVLGVTWDITERRRAEQALRDKAAAEQASQAKSQFLSRMSHELRTPLNAVLGFAQLMSNEEGDALSPQQSERVGRIHSAGLHLLALIDDVLDLATIESDALPLADDAVSLQASLDDVLQWTQVQAAQSGVVVHAQAMPGWVRADPRRLRQILSNLLSNAIKYNRAHGEVWVSVQACTLRGLPAWRVSVRDSGCGLSAEQRSQLFQPFNRLGAERGSVQGTGIGLAIVNHLVRLMGGEVAVTSELGTGSEFSISLPVAQPREPSAHAPLSGFHAELDDAPPAKRLKLLYIEDNAVNVVVVQELIALRGDVDFTVAVDGLSGVAMACESRPHVVLVDMQLPDIDGFEVLRRLRGEATLSGATFVALSANAMAEDVNRALAAGFDDYWTKPIDFHAFLRAVGALAQAHLGR